jgi:hypothetical protein
MEQNTAPNLAAKLKLEVLMREVTKADRTVILATAGYQESTWWSWCRKPTSIPGAALNEVLKHLATKHGRPFTTEEVYQPYI